MSAHSFLAAMILGVSFTAFAFGAERVINLAGTWRFAIGDKDTGLADDLFNRDLPDSIHSARLGR